MCVSVVVPVISLYYVWECKINKESCYE